VAGTNLLWDTCIIKRKLTRTPPEYVDHIDRYVLDAGTDKAKIYMSTIVLAEGRLAGPKPTLADMQKLERDLRGIGSLIEPNPNIMALAGRLRAHSYPHPLRGSDPNAKDRELGLGDAIHLATAIWLKEAAGVSDIVFHSFDNGRGKNWEGKCTPILDFHKYCDGLTSDPDVAKVIALTRTPPRHPALTT
jgi:hypothetical protein